MITRTKSPIPDPTPYINIFRKLAWSFHHTTGLEYDDLFGEACLSYYLYIKDYKPNRGKLTTYVWHSTYTHLINYTKKELFKKSPLCEDLPEDKSSNFTPFFESLTFEAQKIVEILILIPHQFLLLPPPEVEKRLTTIMSKKGWEEERIRVGINNLKTALEIE